MTRTVMILRQNDKNCSDLMTRNGETYVKTSLLATISSHLMKLKLHLITICNYTNIVTTISCNYTHTL